MSMKCSKCGANLEMEMAFCPYCGTENPFAKQHREDMNRFTDDYKKTKEEVIGNSNKFNKKTFRITAAAVTFAAGLLMIFLAVFNDNFSYSYRNKQGKKNAVKYEAEVLEYIANDDYIGLHLFTENKNIRAYNSDVLSPYSDCIYAASYYNELYTELISIYEPGYEYSKYHLSDIESSVSGIYNHLEYVKNDRYEEIPEDAEVYMDHMVRDMGLMLKEYLNLSDENVEKLETSTDAARGVILEEALTNACKEK